MRWPLFHVRIFLWIIAILIVFDKQSKLVTLTDSYPVHINNTLSKSLVFRCDALTQRGIRVMFISREERCPHIASNIHSFRKSLHLIYLDHQYSVITFLKPSIISIFPTIQTTYISTYPTTDLTIKMSQSPPQSPPQSPLQSPPTSPPPTSPQSSSQPPM